MSEKSAMRVIQGERSALQSESVTDLPDAIHRFIGATERFLQLSDASDVAILVKADIPVDPDLQLTGCNREVCIAVCDAGNCLARLLVESGYDASDVLRLLGYISEGAAIVRGGAYRTPHQIWPEMKVQLQQIALAPTSGQKPSVEVEASPNVSTAPPAAQRAGRQYESAIANSPGFADKTDAEVYAWVKENHDPDEDGTLPDLENWARYLREYRRLTGTQKNKPRSGRTHGNSVVRESEI